MTIVWGAGVVLAVGCSKFWSIESEPVGFDFDLEGDGDVVMFDVEVTADHVVESDELRLEFAGDVENVGSAPAVVTLYELGSLPSGSDQSLAYDYVFRTELDPDATRGVGGGMTSTLNLPQIGDGLVLQFALLLAGDTSVVGALDVTATLWGPGEEPDGAELAVRIVER